MPPVAEKFLAAVVGWADQAEVHLVEKETTNIEYTAGQVRVVNRAGRVNLAIRVIKDGRLGFYATTDTTRPEEAAERAVAAAANGQPVKFSFPGPAPAASPRVYDEKAVRMTVADLLALGGALVERIVRAGPEVVVGAEVQRNVTQTTLVNTAGARIERQGTSVDAFLNADRVRQDDVALVWEGHSACGPDPAFDRVADAVARTVRLADARASVRPGKMPVVFDPRLVFVLLMSLELGVDGDNVRRGVSPLAGRLGDKLLDERLTIIEDGTIDSRPNSAGHDSEGVPTRRTPIIEKGVLKTFLYDLKTAAEVGTTPTGHGHRRPGGSPAIATANVIVEPGSLSLDALMADIDEGLYVYDLIGVGNSNAMAGMFSNPVSMAFKIERGRLAGRVKDVSIAGNVYELLRDHLGGLSSESQWTASGIKTPHVRLNDVSVAGKS